MLTRTPDRESSPPIEPNSSPGKRSSKLKKWYIVAAVGLLNGLLLFLVVNLALYAIMGAKRAPTPTLTPTEHLDRDRLQKAYPGWREEDVKDLLNETRRGGNEFEYEPFTAFRERPFRGKFVNIDAAGFRLSKDQAPWPPRPGVTNVFVFGGSTAFGYYLPDDETIASYLQQRATTDHSSAPMAIYNFARPAYISGQELILFQQLLKAGYVPQVAIFIDGLNDFIFADGQPRFTGDMRRFMAGQVDSNPLENVPMVRAAHWLSDRWAKPKPAEKVDYADPSVLDNVIDRWLTNQKMIRLIGAGFGVRTVFVWQPIPMYKYDLRYHLFLHSDKAFAGFVRGEYGYPLMNDLWTHGQLGPDFLWLADIQKDKHENLYVDSVHYNAAFSKAIADHIYSFLREPPQQAQTKDGHRSDLPQH